MPAAALMAAGSVASSFIGSSASKKAAGIQANAAMMAAHEQAQAMNRAIEMQKEFYAKGEAAIAPFRDVGTSAMFSLADLYGLPTPAGASRGASEGGSGAARGALDVFRASPEYQIPFQEGLKAVEYSRASKNMLRNPGTARDLMQWGQGFAGSRLDGYIGTLLKIAGIGGNAANQQLSSGTAQGTALGNTIMTGGANQANLLMQGGQAQASGVVGSANAWMQGIAGATNNLAAYSLLNPTGSAYGGGGASPALSSGSYSMPFVSGQYNTQFSNPYGTLAAYNMGGAGTATSFGWGA